MAVSLTRELALEERRTTPDGAGGFVVSWVVLGFLWAQVTPRSGTEFFASFAPRSRILHRILVRAAPPGAPSRPRPEQRFREGERVFDILSVTEASLSARYLEIQAEEGRTS
ncbi:MAG: head-tail adaptor protein [Rhodobacteraceae bacterium]|nr:head-tail adaptor protein [Paracoccaceae bacterium]